MTAEKFRAIALSMTEACENAHMGHPDFRVGGKIFATLGYPDSRFGVVSLPPEEQERFLETYPDIFTPAKGDWGRRGATVVRLEGIDEVTLRRVISLAWKRRAPKALSKDRPND